MLPRQALAAAARMPFDQWIAAFRAKALAHGITAETYARVMSGVKPDTTGLEAIHNQPEFNEQLWQYLNRRVSDWRIIAGREKAQEYAPLLARIERDYGVEPSFMLGVWGIESDVRRSARREESYAPGHPVAGDARLGRAAPPHLLGKRADQRADHHSDAAGARRPTWSARGPAPWATPSGCRKSGCISAIDYDGDGKISPFGPPDDALATTARYFVERGNYRRGEHWGYEVRAARQRSAARRSRSYAEWQKLGVVRADGEPFPRPERESEALGAGARRSRVSAWSELLSR